MTEPNWKIILTLLEWLLFFITFLASLGIVIVISVFTWNFFKSFFKKKT